MTLADVRKASAMLRDPNMTKAEVAEHFGVSRMTLNASLKLHALPDTPGSPGEPGA